MKFPSENRGQTPFLLLGASVLAVSAAASAEEPLWETHPNHFSVVLAATDDGPETAFTVGGDYEHRVNGFLGIGGVVERAFGEIDATTLLAVADLHLWRGLAVQTGPGVELVDSRGEERAEEEFVYRIGALYEFEFGHATFSPQVHYDVTTGEDAVVFGGALGYYF